VWLVDHSHHYHPTKENLQGWYHMMSGPNNATAQVKEKSGGTTTSAIRMRSNLVTFRSATGVVDSRRYNGFSDQLSKLSGVEATFNARTARLDEEATKAEATEQNGRKRAMTFMTKTFFGRYTFLQMEKKSRVVSKDCVCHWMTAIRRSQKAYNKESVRKHDPKNKRKDIVGRTAIMMASFRGFFN
jgi:hypothetical protein